LLDELDVIESFEHPGKPARYGVDYKKTAGAIPGTGSGHAGIGINCRESREYGVKNDSRT